MIYIFIDESGDLGLGGSKYLVLSALIIEDYFPLDRMIKNMRRHKFRKELRKASEIKANRSSDELRRYMLKKLNEAKNTRVLYIVLEKKKLYSEYLKNNKHKLYNYVAGKLARQITLDNVNVEIRIDKSKGKQILREDFNNYFLKSLNERSTINRATVHHSYSHSWAGLQFADMLAWACFHKFEHNNSEFIDLVQLEQEVCHVW
ncbi:MAG: hypothetical protein LAKADJCE_00858 [Candidatus Argoarchaeum ethanivorans]|uniref:DUF3800 domain-containing protein n=1 Tax=Candidatus Argoarchaeum ethanivorans TaxID=2608793 RepID=A0A811TGL5_9EURY|nr:MAG: hypothetical protein LAKADJCE_00858 [Candidatus Argoarchaeum ethanivorans]